MSNLIKVFFSVLFATIIWFHSDPVAAQKTIKLTFHSSFGKSPLNMAPRGWMDEVEKRTNGKVKFNRVSSVVHLVNLPPNQKILRSVPLILVISPWFIIPAYTL